MFDLGKRTVVIARTNETVSRGVTEERYAVGNHRYHSEDVTP